MGSTSDEFGEELINRFFARLKVIYGAARYSSVFPDEAAEACAKREWGKDILRYSPHELLAKIQYAKAMSHKGQWRWLDIGLILAGDRPGGAAGQAAMSYRPATEVIGLPNLAPKKEISNGFHRRMEKLKSVLD